MITFTNEEMLALIDELTAQELRIYLYLLSTNTQEWAEISVRKISKALKAARKTIQKALVGLMEKNYIKIKENEEFTEIKILGGGWQPKWPPGQPKWPPHEEHIRNIKRERVYYIFLFNIIFLFLQKNNFLSLSDIPYREQKGGSESGHPGSESGHPQIYSLGEEFYQQIRELGIKVNDELKQRLELLGWEKVSDLYYQVTWDNSIRKPGTIFLREITKAYEEKRKEEAENRKEASNYKTWAGSRELSLKEIYLSYKNMKKEKLVKCWRDKSSFFGYTEEEMSIFEEEVINKEIKEELEKEKEN